MSTPKQIVQQIHILPGEEIFSPEAVAQCLIHKCKGHIFAQSHEDGHWVWYNPNKHEGHKECVRAVYVVSGQVINRDRGAEVLGAQYSPKASDHKTYKKHKCEYFKIICCLNAQDGRLHIATCFAERFKPRVDALQRSISGFRMFQHARDTVFVNYQAGSTIETHKSRDIESKVTGYSQLVPWHINRCILTMKLYNAYQGDVTVVTGPVLYESLSETLPSIRVENSTGQTMLKIMQEIKQNDSVGHKFLSSTRRRFPSTQTEKASMYQGRKQIIPSFFWQQR